MEITLQPIGIVHNSRRMATDDYWGDIISEIRLEEYIPAEALENIMQFSHLEIIYYFDRVGEDDIKFSGRPRDNPAYPVMGIFAQRKKDRPNRIGLCNVQLIEVNARTLRVKGLDAIDGTPVIDIKPVFKEFLPKGEITQPEWATDLMRHYWQ